MRIDNPKELYDLLKYSKNKYNEEKHCVMLLEILPVKWRVGAFCIEALITEQTFYEWVNKYEIFKTCYGVAQLLAHEAWEQEEVDNIDNEDWDRKTWLQRGSRYFAKDKAKIKLEVDCMATPWEQYQQILKQAEKGDFNASEIKQLMESINVGTRVYETFKLQTELDKIKEDFNEMSQRHGNNTISIVKDEDFNQASLSD